MSDLLARRASAVRQRDAAAFRATIDARDRDFSAAQDVLFRNLLGLPLAEWRYGSVSDVRPLSTSGASTSDAAFEVDADLVYRLDPFDARPVHSPRRLTLLHRGGAWVLGAEEIVPDLGMVPEVWELGRVTVARGRRSLVVLRPVEGRSAGSFVSEGDRAVSQVSSVWGEGVPVVVVVPASQDEAVRLLRDDRPLDAVAAVTTGQTIGSPRPRAGPRPPTGERVVVNPRAFDTLTPTGRAVVLTHEATHVAVRASSGPVPMWLSEGFADYVALRGRGLAVASAAPTAMRHVRRHGPPPVLPRDRDFVSGGANGAAAYELSWLACRLLAQRYGEPALVRFYRTAAVTDRGRGAAGGGQRATVGRRPAIGRGQRAADGGPSAPDGGVSLRRAFRELGTTQQAFLRQWRAELDTLRRGTP